MKKFLLVGLLSVLFVGCEKTATDVSGYYATPDELADCTFTQLSDKYGSSMTVVRCPNSVTSVKEPKGKTSQTTIVVDGVEYVKK